jgi:hypothetical protein
MTKLNGAFVALTSGDSEGILRFWNGDPCLQAELRVKGVQSAYDLRTHGEISGLERRARRGRAAFVTIRGYWGIIDSSGKAVILGGGLEDIEDIAVKGLSVSADGNTWCVRHSMGVCVMRADGELVQRFASSDATAQCVAADNKTVILAGSGLEYYREGSAQAQKRLKGHDLKAMSFFPDGRYLVCQEGGVRLAVFEVSTGERVLEFAGDAGVTAIDVCGGGHRMVTAHENTLIQVWSLVPVIPDAKGNVSVDELIGVIRTGSAMEAYQAGWKLRASGGEVVPPLERFVMGLGVNAESEIKELLRQFCSDSIEEREGAFRALLSANVPPEVLLRWSAQSELPAEQSAKLAKVVQWLSLPMAKSKEQVAACRAITVLEWIGTKQSLAALQRIAKGCAIPWLRNEAEASYGRMTQK